MKNKNHLLTIATIISLFISSTGCFRKFYKTNSISKPAGEKMAVADSGRKMVFVHFSDTIIFLKDVIVKHDTISGIPQSLPENTNYLYSLSEKPNRFNKKDKDSVLSRAHIYLDETMVPDINFIQIESSRIVRFDVYELDKKATRKSKTAGIIGIIIGSLATLFAAFIIGVSIAYGALGG